MPPAKRVVMTMGYFPAAPGGAPADRGLGLHLQKRCFRLAEKEQEGG